MWKHTCGNSIDGEECYRFRNQFDLVFTDTIGRPLSHSCVEHDFRKYKVAGHRFHDLRHTFATEALRHGADAKTISEALGHYSVGFTLDVYAHVSEEMADNFAALMSTIISERKIIAFFRLT